MCVTRLRGLGLGISACGWAHFCRQAVAVAAVTLIPLLPPWLHAPSSFLWVPAASISQPPPHPTTPPLRPTVRGTPYSTARGPSRLPSGPLCGGRLTQQHVVHHATPPLRPTVRGTPYSTACGPSRHASPQAHCAGDALLNSTWSIML